MARLRRIAVRSARGSRAASWWSAWLALLLVLPLAQSAGLAHQLSHTASAVAETGRSLDGIDTAHGLACELCLQAASTLLAAPAPTVAAITGPTVAHAAPTHALQAGQPALAPRPYAARAPPLA